MSFPGEPYELSHSLCSATETHSLGLLLRQGESNSKAGRGAGMGSWNLCSEEMAILGANLQESGGFHSPGHEAAGLHEGKLLTK